MNSPRSQAAPAPPPRPHQGALANLQQFWHRITEGLELSELWKQFSTDARASYRFYERDFKARAPEDKKRGFWRTAQAFAWAILEKLTPARRVLLLLGVVLLIFPAGGYSHRTEEGHVEFVEFDLRFLGGASLFMLLMLEIADRVVMKRDLEIARDIQRWLLPASPPEVPGMTMAFATRPANTVAGDYYDVFARPRPGDAPLFLFAVADVAGKSIPAALLMATFQAGLKTLSATPCSFVELVAGMNRYASTNSQDGRRFTTAFLAEYDSHTRALTYINAGHNTPILRHSSGAIERLSNGGVPLGILADAPYQSGTVTLQSGDWLVIFTDGVVEALNTKGEEYEEPRLLNVLQNGITATPEELLRRLMTDLDAFVGTTPQHDDVTCMLIKVS
ncbi:Serine phosphatase [Candidatus Sulfotelmatobacter sp. SbA7]|jgi:phosphoserine phosphatase RsbU/P|nr:Serine phosphatase [Candidatus Sulfotelmatobacter sp. SbA7]